MIQDFEATDTVVSEKRHTDTHTHTHPLIHPPEILRGNQRRLQSVFVTHSPIISKRKKAVSEGSINTALTRLEILR